MNLEEVKKKFGSVLESALIGIQKLPTGGIFKKSDTEMLFTGQEAEDRVIKITPFGGMPEDKGLNPQSMFVPNDDGSFKYNRRKNFKKHESYEMMEQQMKRIGTYKRRR